MGVAIYCTVATIALIRLEPGWRRNTVFGASTAIFIFSAISRPALGAHWPSDVLGSVLLGGVWLIVTTRLYLSLRRPGGLPRPLRRCSRWPSLYSWRRRPSVWCSACAGLERPASSRAERPAGLRKLAVALVTVHRRCHPQTGRPGGAARWFVSDVGALRAPALLVSGQGLRAGVARGDAGE